MCIVHFDNVAVAAVTQKLVWSVDTALSGCNWKETMNRLKPCYCWDVNETVAVKHILLCRSVHSFSNLQHFWVQLSFLLFAVMCLRKQKISFFCSTLYSLLYTGSQICICGVWSMMPLLAMLRRSTVDVWLLCLWRHSTAWPRQLVTRLVKWHSCSTDLDVVPLCLYRFITSFDHIIYVFWFDFSCCYHCF